MKIFDRDFKINFVDVNNVFLGYDMNLQCTERAGWFISDRDDNSLNGIKRNPAYELLRYNSVLPEKCEEYFLEYYKKLDEYHDRIEDYNDELEDYVFDTNYFKEYKFKKHSELLSTKAIFRIIDIDDKDEKFIHLYNLQNGWYCHGFEFGKKILLNQGEL